MRALLIKELDQILGDPTHFLLVEKEFPKIFFHLTKVARVREKEEVLLLNGLGLKIFGQVENIKKTSLQITIQKRETQARPFALDVALGLVKKEAYASSIKNAVELGIRNFFPLITVYSQHQFPLSTERCEALVESSMMQSNNPFALAIAEPQTFQAFFAGEIPGQYDLILGLSEKQLRAPNKTDFAWAASSKVLLVLGPEGGFQASELETLKLLANAQALHLPSYLLRTQTALCAGVGFLLAHFH